MSSVGIKKDKKKEKKVKKKETSSTNQTAQDTETQNRGAASASGYRPPLGSVPLVETIDSETFDYDALKDDEDLELWIIRAPEGISPKHLVNQQLPIPSSSHTQQVGTLSRKHATYDIWSVCPQTIGNEGRPPAPAGGDETLGLTCLVPRKKKGSKLFIAPKPVVHHLVLTAQPALPTPPTSPPEPFRRYCHPETVLKHRFLVAGSSIPNTKTPATDIMQVDESSEEHHSLNKYDKKKISGGQSQSSQGEATGKVKKRKIVSDPDGKTVSKRSKTKKD